MRFALFLVALVCGGCLSGSGRSGRAAFARDRELVHDAVAAVARPSFDRNLRGAGWEAHRWSSGASSVVTSGSLLRGSREDVWDVQFACRKPGAESEEWRLPVADYRRVLDPIRADILAAVEKTGVEVVAAPEVELIDGPNPEAKFVIRYLRTKRKVGGEIVGRLAPTDCGKGPHYTDLRVTLNERSPE
ncbi:MAG TPA: hypothetical protein VGE74_15745 [Gemmata sp.]